MQQVLIRSRGETMPKKTTYFYPKLTSGRFSASFVSPWLDLCRAASPREGRAGGDALTGGARAAGGQGSDVRRATAPS
jgi:hypothetical protein